MDVIMQTLLEYPLMAGLTGNGPLFYNWRYKSNSMYLCRFPHVYLACVSP